MKFKGQLRRTWASESQELLPFLGDGSRISLISFFDKLPTPWIGDLLMQNKKFQRKLNYHVQVSLLYQKCIEQEYMLLLISLLYNKTCFLFSYDLKHKNRCHNVLNFIIYFLAIAKKCPGR